MLDSDLCIPDPQWKAEIQHTCCTQCKTILPSFTETDPGARICLQIPSVPLRGAMTTIGRGMSSVSWQLIRRDLANALRLTDAGFKLWPVIQDGLPLQEYACMSKPYAVRVLCFADDVQSGKFCVRCGRINILYDVMKPLRVWAPFLRTRPLLRHEAPVPARHVFTCQYASRFLVTAEALAAVPESLRRELGATECEVVESLH